MRNAKGALQAVLAGVMLLSASPAGAADVDPESRFTIGRLKYGGGGDWYSNPTSLPNLLTAMSERTSVATTPREVNVRISDDDLYSTPFLYMTGHGRVTFTDDEVRRLREFLEAGGFLWGDDNYGMDKHFRAQIQKVFPDRDLVELPFSHPIYHSFYDFDGGPPKIHEHDGLPAQGLGVFYEGRLVVFYTYQSDIGDGLEDASVHNDPPDVRESALRMAINVAVFSLTQ